ncbi:hypothetical protein [Paracoccus sp. (in: a-proteobacteria)]|uniref:hypothetical protein n=1 Tax=Paracoccus sp. TaxID=267 RepID=UPI0035B3C50F
MHDDDPGFAGQLDNWPSPDALAQIFLSEGYRVRQGRYSISLDDFEHFEFRELGGDLGPGSISAESASAKALTGFAGRVSQTLAKAGIRHRFEIYSATDELIAYLHHDWPKDCAKDL